MENIKNIINIKNINFNINMILRIILTETNKGPDIYSIIYLIGKEKFIKRLNIFIKIGERGFEPLTY
nr:hypothetical protein [Candidatus Nardonella dryophthoridicola]